MADSAPLAKLWFQIPNTAALLICKYGATNANSSSGREKKTKNRVHSWVLFVRNLCRERLQNVVHSVCGQKAITARKLLTPSDYAMSFKKKRGGERKTAQISHHMLSIPRLQLGASEEILTFMRATSLNPLPPSLVSTAGFILSAGTMTGEEKGMLSPLAGQHWENIHANETFFMSPGLKWHFYDMKSRGNKMLLCLPAPARTKETLHLWLVHSINRLETLYSD